MRDSDDQAVPRPTGFASPAEDYAETSLNLQHFAVRHPEATFYWEAKGDGMRDAGITSGDILIVDRAVEVVPRDVVVVAVQGEYLVRRWLRAPDGIVLACQCDPDEKIRRTI